MSDSKRWLQEHFRDPYVKKAQKEGYLSRAAYKLLEIQEKDRILRTGMVVVDLGAAPGGWSQVAGEIVGKNGCIIAVDLLPMTPIAGVEFIQGDFNDPEIYSLLLQTVRERKGDEMVDLVLSDMAPNLSGQKTIDQARSLHLVELAWHCALNILKPGGSLLFKIFQGPGVDDLFKELRTHFKNVKIRKPKSSRARSSEVYILANGFLRYNKDSTT